MKSVKLFFLFTSLIILSACSSDNSNDEVVPDSSSQIEETPPPPTFPSMAENCVDIDGVEGEPPVGFSGISFTCNNSIFAKSKGKVLTKSVWKDNELIEWAEYYDNGVLYRRNSYLNEQKEGDALTYYTNGTLMKKEIYKNGSLMEQADFSIRGKVLTHWIRKSKIDGITCENCKHF